MTKLSALILALALAGIGYRVGQLTRPEPPDQEQATKHPDQFDHPLTVTPKGSNGQPLPPAGLDAWASTAWTPPVLKKLK